MSAAVAVPPRIEVSDTSQKEADYDDDFEDFDKELDSFIASEDSSQSDNKAADDKESSRKQSAELSDSQPEKGTEEIEKGQKEYSSPPHKTAELDADDYTFSDDQKRAMRELIAQRQENDFPDEDPPEYDVKDRLIQLNAELAQESDPGERAHKVGFKETLVDLVAPPPDFSDDEDSQKGKSNPTSPRETEVVSSKSSVNPTSKPTDGKKKTVVVEREGKFEVVNIDDLTPTERQMYVCDPDPDPPAKEGGPKKNVNNCNIHEKSKQPSPPKQPRPATANGNTNRRALRPVQSKQRPKSAANQVSNESRSLENFSYTSPYALSAEQKELARQRAKAMEDHKREQDRRKREERETEQRESDEAFRAWLKQKREEIRKRRDRDLEEKRKEERTDKDWSDGEADSLTKEENEVAFRTWLKEKRLQIQRDKLLKHRQDQEMKDGYQTVSRDECDKAFKEWIKKKNIESRKMKVVERQKSRSARISAKRSRRSASLLRAIRNSQSFQYVDYYGYRF